MWFKKQISFSQFTEQELLELSQEGQNIEVSAELFLRYRDLVYGVCLKYMKTKDDAKDATMEVFEDLHRKLHNHEIRNFKSWLYSLVRNYCLMQLRSKQKHKETEISEEAEEVFMESEMELHPITEKEIEFMQMESAMEQLSKQQAECLKMFYLQEMSYRDISDETGYDLKKVKSYIQNGKRNLAIKMKKSE